MSKRAMWMVGLGVVVGCSGGSIDVSPTSPVEPTTATESPTATVVPVTETQNPTTTPTMTPVVSPTPATPTPTAVETPTQAPPTPTVTPATPEPTLPPDSDGDGSPDVDDCAPDDAAIFPGQDEICDEVDNDCDLQVDEGLDSDLDGIADCFDEEECDGLDNDGDGAVDESLSDLDGDLICDALDDDRDGDRVENDDDPAPDDATINANPTDYFQMPGDGWLYLYAPDHAQVTVMVDQGDGFVQIDGSPFIVPTDSATRANLSQGTVKISASAPVVAFYADDLDLGSGDQGTVALDADGMPGGKKLYTYAANTVSVVAGPNTPGTVRVESSMGTGWNVISSVNMTSGGGHTFNVPGSNIYRIRTTSGEVSAYGDMNDTAMSSLVYLSDSTSFVGDAFRYTRAATATPILVGVQTLVGDNDISIRRAGVPVQTNSLASAGDTAYFQIIDGAVYDVVGDGDLLAWIEADDSVPSADEGMRGAELVPGLNGETLAENFLFTTSRSTADGFRSDVDILIYDDETWVKVRQRIGGVWSNIYEGVGDQGERLPVVSEAMAESLIEITASRPIRVSHSHGEDEFAGGLAICSQFFSQARALEQSCDPTGLLDHCAVGLECSADSICIDPLAEEETPTISPSPDSTESPVDESPTPEGTASEGEGSATPSAAETPNALTPTP